MAATALQAFSTLHKAGTPQNKSLRAQTDWSKEAPLHVPPTSGRMSNRDADIRVYASSPPQGMRSDPRLYHNFSSFILTNQSMNKSGGTLKIY